MFPGDGNKKSDDSGDLTPPLILAESVAYWQQRTPYQQFLWFGIWRPESYDRTQRLIAEGPETWQEHGGEFALLARAWRADDEIDPQAFALLEACDRRETLAGEPWAKESLAESLKLSKSSPVHFADSLAEGLSLAESLKQYMRDCGNFFRIVGAYGLARGAVVMADNESHLSHEQAHEQLARVLRRCIPKAEDRMRLFEEVLAREQDHDTRAMALCFLPAEALTDDKIAGLLKGLANDPSEVIRFWAAFQFSRIDPTASWLLPALLNGFQTGITWGYDSDLITDGHLAIEALKRVGPQSLGQAARQLALQGKWEPAASCCEALRRWPGADTTALLADLRQQLLREIPNHWFDCRRQRRLAFELLEKAAERLAEQCWTWYSVMEDQLSGPGNLLGHLRRTEESLHGYLHGWQQDGQSLIGTLYAVHQSIQRRLNGRSEALPVLEEVDQLLQEAKVAMAESRRLGEMGQLDPTRMGPLQVIEDILTSAQNLPEGLGEGKTDKRT